MCQASINAEETYDAQEGDVVRIRKDSTGQPFFHTEDDADDVVTCIQTGGIVIVNGLSPELAHHLGVENEIEGIFAQDPSDRSDAIWLGADRFVSLYELVEDGDVPSLYYAGDVSGGRKEVFLEACTAHFEDVNQFDEGWGYPFEESGPTELNAADGKTGLVLDALPAVLMPSGATMHPDELPGAEVVDDTQSKSERVLEDA